MAYPEKENWSRSIFPPERMNTRLEAENAAGLSCPPTLILFILRTARPRRGELRILIIRAISTAPIISGLLPWFLTKIPNSHPVALPRRQLLSRPTVLLTSALRSMEAAIRRLSFAAPRPVRYLSSQALSQATTAKMRTMLQSIVGVGILALFQTTHVVASTLLLRLMRPRLMSTRWRRENTPSRWK